MRATFLLHAALILQKEKNPRCLGGLYVKQRQNGLCVKVGLDSHVNSNIKIKIKNFPLKKKLIFKIEFLELKKEKKKKKR